MYTWCYVLSLGILISVCFGNAIPEYRTNLKVEDDILVHVPTDIATFTTLLSQQADSIADLKYMHETVILSLKKLEDDVNKQQVKMGTEMELLRKENNKLKEEVRMLSREYLLAKDHRATGAKKEFHGLDKDVAEYSMSEPIVAEPRTGASGLGGPQGLVYPAFSAQATIHQTTLNVNDTITFDEILTNVCGCFSANSSVFHVPYDGIYYFTCSTMSKDDIQTEITVNGDNSIARMFTGTHDDDFDQGVNMGVVILRAGDEVWVRKTAGGNNLIGDGWTSFSGYMIVAIWND